MSATIKTVSNKRKQSISDTDLINAYRKTKVDLYYSNRQDFQSLLTYEKDLKFNLKRLQGIIKDGGPVSDFGINTQSYSLLGKSVEKKKDDGSEYDVTFRLMEKFSIDFHVLSSLWIQKIGEKIDAEFDDNIIYGNRLRRRVDKSLNQNALGNFKPYSPQYGAWQNNAIISIKDSLDANKAVSVFSTDVKTFYHTIPLEVLRSREMNEYVGEEYKSLHGLFTNCLFEWRDQVLQDPLFNNSGSEDNSKKHIGIPVGLSASCIIANWVMKQFDEEVLRKLTPIYYGRYVDDILLVFPKISSKIKPIKTIPWLKEQLPCLNPPEKDEGLYYRFGYTDIADNKSKYIIFPFNTSKNQDRTFEGEFGLVELETFIRQRNENTSEWRALPELPNDSKWIKTRLLEILTKKNDKSLTLGSFEKISQDRMKFAFALRDYEACLRIFPPSAWEEQRIAFLKMFAKYFITPEQFFEYEKYFYRVLTLGVVCKDYRATATLLDSFAKMISELGSKVQEYDIAGPKDFRPYCNKEILFNNYQNTVLGNIENFIERSCGTFDFSKIPQYFEKSQKLSQSILYNSFLKWANGLASKKEKRKTQSLDYYSHDLGVFPFKYQSFPWYLNPLYFYNEKVEKQNPLDKEEERTIKKYGGKRAVKMLNYQNLYPYFFPTRPYTSNDLSFVKINASSPEEDWKGSKIFELLKYLRGYSLRDGIDEIQYSSGGVVDDKYLPNSKLDVPSDYNKSKIPIAIACWRMSESEILDHLHDKVENSKIIALYHRFSVLINQMLSSPIPIRYVVFPELALPPRWFLTAAMKLQKKNICLISGIQYIFDCANGGTKETKSSATSNEVWASLDYNSFEFPNYIIYRQQKQAPAFDELRMLTEEAGLAFTPSEPVPKVKHRWPPVIKHGHFFFSLLVCSEMLNVKLRSTLTGKVDALFAVEWNKDVTTFNSLVESSAMDLHAYIVQCNNNKYGDCRIRAPYRNDYERDVVKSKGGENDYFMIGKVDVESLREYHLTTLPEVNGKYKPFPVGFEMSEERRNDWKQIKQKK